VLELSRDLIPDTLKLPPHLRRTLVRVTRQSVQVFLMSHFLLFLLDFQRTDVLLKLTLLNTVVVLSVLKLDLRFLF
jgi:hypothetical protein